MRMCFRRRLTLLAAATLTIVATSAEAGRQVLVDFHDPNDGPVWPNFPFSGQKWDGDTTFSTSVQGGSTFALNVGTGTPLSSFTFDPMGRVVFANGFFIAPLYSPSFSGGSLSWGSGRIDAQLLAPAVANPVYSDANLVSAYRFTWNGTSNQTFQALLVDRGNGDFDLDFNYSPFNGPAPANATAGYRLGSNTASFAGPYATVGPDYCFRGGVGGLCGAAAVTPVPEPTTHALVLGGLAMLVGVHRWRRSSADRTA